MVIRMREVEQQATSEEPGPDIDHQGQDGGIEDKGDNAVQGRSSAHAL